VQQGGAVDVSRKWGVLPCNNYLLLADEDKATTKKKKAKMHRWGQRDDDCVINSDEKKFLISRLSMN